MPQNQRSYHPLQNGIRKEFHNTISYEERHPDSAHQTTVSCFWSLKSNGELSQDFLYTVMPDACIDIIFDCHTDTSPFVMSPHLSIEEINLEKTFHYMGIRLQPGVLTHTIVDPKTIIGQQRDITQIGDIDLQIYNHRLHNADAQFFILEELLSKLLDQNLVMQNNFINTIVEHMQRRYSVEEIANLTSYSTRQFRRKVKEQTGFSPVQLLRVIRFQEALSTNDVSLRFADQSHLIKEFRDITGSSYSHFKNQF